MNFLLKVCIVFFTTAVFIGYFFAISRESNLDTSPVKLEIKSASNSSMFGKFSIPMLKEKLISYYKSAISSLLSHEPLNLPGRKAP